MRYMMLIGGLQRYYLFQSARADLLRRAEDWLAAYDAYLKALDLAQNAVERAFLQRRLEEVRARLS